jgi:hypothetical protein
LSSKRSRTPPREHQPYCKELANNIHSFNKLLFYMYF